MQKYEIFTRWQNLLRAFVKIGNKFLIIENKMATKRIAKIEPAFRRWLSEEEAIGWLNITRREWEERFKFRMRLYPGGNYDKEQLNKMMEAMVVINPK